MKTPVIAGLLVLLVATAVSGSELFVATNGNDEWSGRLAEPNAAGTDGPFATLVRARDEARRQRADGQPVKVVVRGGTYFLESPFVLEPEDSGTKERPALFAAYPGEMPVFSGGRRIAGWSKGPGQLWQVELPEVKSGQWYFRQLFVDGKRRGAGAFTQRGIPSHRPVGSRPARPACQADCEGPVRVCGRRYRALGAARECERGLDALVGDVDSPGQIGEYGDTHGRVYGADAGMVEHRLLGAPSSGTMWKMRLKLLDEPGEWYLNRETGVLSYWPLPGESMDDTEFIAPVLSELVRFAGDADADRFVEHVTVRGLSFQHSDWILDPSGNSSTRRRR